jgi:hypothetical protein
MSGPIFAPCRHYSRNDGSQGRIQDNNSETQVLTMWGLFRASHGLWGVQRNVYMKRPKNRLEAVLNGEHFQDSGVKVFVSVFERIGIGRVFKPEVRRVNARAPRKLLAPRLGTGT